MLRAVVIAAVAIVALVAVLVWWSYASFERTIAADVARLAAGAAPRVEVVTEAMLRDLPDPAERYFRRAGVVGAAIPRTVHLLQSGRIRSSADSAWMPFEAEETYSITPPGLVWQVRLPTRAMPLAVGRDAYLDGRGSILVKLGALVPMADEHGPELGDAGLMRFLNEMTSFPAAMLLPNVRIEPVDDDSFRLTISDGGTTATGVLVIDQDGLPVTFRALRYNTGTRAVETWETPFAGYAHFEGLDLPNGGMAVWKLPSGDLEYIELTISGIAYGD